MGRTTLLPRQSLPGQLPLIGGRAPLKRVSLLTCLLAFAVASVWTTGLCEPSRSLAADRRTAVSPDSAETLELAGLEENFLQVAGRISSSVVAISSSLSAVDADEALRTDTLNTDRLEAMLDRTTRTVGTGFVISEDGLIVTNEHVIAEAQQLWVTTDDRRVYPAIVVGSDPRSDLAVLKVPASGLTPVTFSQGQPVRRGQWTIAFGNPYGLAAEGSLSMSVGVVSAVDRSLPKLASRENRLYTNLIQTTAQINPGNSGGPLFDLHGRVIGIITAVVLPQKQTNGIGFAMPLTPRLMDKIRDLSEGREVVYAYLGAMVSTATLRQRRDAGVSGDVGVMIDSVEADAPAGKSGIAPGDVVTSIGGASVNDSDEFVRLVGEAPVGTPVRFELRRHGRATSLDVVLRKRQLPTPAITRDTQRFRWRGMLLGPVPANWQKDKDKEGSAGGVMVFGIDPASPLVKQGVACGTVIVSVGGRLIRDLAELQRAINELPAEQCSVLITKPDTSVAVNGQ